LSPLRAGSVANPLAARHLPQLEAAAGRDQEAAVRAQGEVMEAGRLDRDQREFLAGRQLPDPHLVETHRGIPELARPRRARPVVATRLRRR